MKIYISATYRDLVNHRQAVGTVLRRMGHQVVGMEDYVAEGLRPLHRCLQDVAGCDVYVGIFAWRYGSIPTATGADGVELPAGTTLGETSVTEFEFRQAIAQKKPTLVFVLDPDAEWPSNQVDAIAGDAVRAQAVARLRNEVSQDYLVSYFRTPEDLAGLVSAAVYRAEIGRQMDFKSLKIDVGLNENFVRQNNVTDTTLAEVTRVISAAAAEIGALQIKLGHGREWWMTRLYFLCSLAADLTPIGTVAFVGAEDAFVGIVHPRVVKDRLAQADATIRQYETDLADAGPQATDLEAEVSRRAGLWEMCMGTTGGEHLHPTFVTAAALERWLDAYWIAQAIDWDANDNAALQMQRLLDWPARYVPIVEAGKFARVVDKQALTEQVAKLFIREQVSRALSTVR
jgi:hypothetical protein